MKPTIIDCHYQGPEHAASYLLADSGEAAFIENNTAKATPYLMRALDGQGIPPEAVRYAIITHLHFDHAGGTSALVAACPNATVLAHPRAVRHLIDPSRLVASARQVYGEEEFERLYGAILPIAADRVRAMEDGETVQLGARMLRFLHTRGHANHHFCIHDLAENAIYTGDMFGVEYRKSRVCVKPFLLCSAAPTDFDPEEARASLERLVDLKPARLYLTHFGELEDVAGGAEVLRSAIGQMESILREAMASPLTGDALVAFCEERVRAAIEAHVTYCGAVLSEQDRVYIDPHANINAQGIALLAEKRR